MPTNSKERTAWDNPRAFLEMTDEQIIAQVMLDFKHSESFSEPYFDKFMKYFKAYRAHQDPNELREDGSNLYIPYIYNIVENAFPKIVKSLFSVRPYLPYLPTNRKDPEAVQKAKNMTNLVEWEFDNKMKGRLVYNTILRDICIYGTAISKQTWKLEERTVVKRMNVVEPQTDPITGLTVNVESEVPMETQEIIYDAPFIQNVALTDFFIDPYAIDIDSAAYCIHRYYLPMHTVLQMCRDGKLDISEKDLKEKVGPTENRKDNYQKTTVAGGGQRGKRINEVEVFEYWTNDLKCLVFNRSVVGLVALNPYWHRRKPFSKWECVPISGEFYGIGIVEMCMQLQAELNTTRNQRIDNVSYALNRMYSILRSANIDVTQLKSRPNGFIEVDDHNDLQEITVHEVKDSAYTEESVIKNDMDVTSGVYNYTRGEPADRRETATTASILSQAGNDRFETEVLQIGWGGFSDSAMQLAWLNRQYIDKETDITIVGENGQLEDATISSGDIDVDLQIIPAPSSLFSEANRQIQQNALVQLSNILVNNPVVNQEEFLKRVFEAFNFENPDKLIAESNPAMATPTDELSTVSPQPGEETAVATDVNALSPVETPNSTEDMEFLNNIL